MTIRGEAWNEKGACLTAVVFLATGLTLIPEGMPLHAILERMAASESSYYPVVDMQGSLSGICENGSTIILFPFRAKNALLFLLNEDAGLAAGKEFRCRFPGTLYRLRDSIRL